VPSLDFEEFPYGFQEHLASKQPIVPLGHGLQGTLEYCNRFRAIITFLSTGHGDLFGFSLPADLFPLHSLVGLSPTLPEFDWSTHLGSHGKNESMPIPQLADPSR